MSRDYLPFKFINALSSFKAYILFERSSLEFLLQFLIALKNQRELVDAALIFMF